MKINYKVVKSPLQPGRWAIMNTSTGKIVEGGFFCQVRATNYMWQKYSAPRFSANEADPLTDI